MGGCQIKIECGFSKVRLCLEKLLPAGERDCGDRGGGLVVPVGDTGIFE